MTPPNGLPGGHESGEPAAAGGAPASGPRYNWQVVSVIPLFPGRITVTFADGTTRNADLSSMIYAHDPGVFANLRDETFFNSVRVVDGTVSWPGEIDIASDALWETTHDSGDPWDLVFRHGFQ